jgi:hypothetical protein
LYLIVLSAISAGLMAGCGGDDGEGTPGGAGGAGGAPALSCPVERDEVLGPVDAASTGEVTVLSDEGGVKTLYIDASAGGPMEQENNPWIYVSLEKAARVDVTDPGADASLDWDLALKRPVLRTNSGDGGPGEGGSAFLKDKAFDAVTDAEAKAASLAVEQWFEAMCVVKKDAGGYLATTFDGWYDYGGQTTHAVTPHPGVFVVRAGKGGSLYKLEILTYYSNPDGTDGMAGGRFLVRYKAIAP